MENSTTTGKAWMPSNMYVQTFLSLWNRGKNIKLCWVFPLFPESLKLIMMDELHLLYISNGKTLKFVHFNSKETHILKSLYSLCAPAGASVVTMEVGECGYQYQSTLFASFTGPFFHPFTEPSTTATLCLQFSFIRVYFSSFPPKRAIFYMKRST